MSLLGLLYTIDVRLHLPVSIFRLCFPSIMSTGIFSLRVRLCILTGSCDGPESRLVLTLCNSMSGAVPGFFKDVKGTRTEVWNGKSLPSRGFQPLDPTCRDL